MGRWRKRVGATVVPWLCGSRSSTRKPSPFFLVDQGNTDSGVWPALPRAQAWVFSCLGLGSLLSEVDPVGPDGLKAPGTLSTCDFLSPSCRCLMATNASESGVWGYATLKPQCHVTESSRTLEKQRCHRGFQTCSH